MTAIFQYINPGEEFLLRLLLSARPVKITPTFRQPGVGFVVQQYSVPTSLIMTDVLLATIKVLTVRLLR